MTENKNTQKSTENKKGQTVKEQHDDDNKSDIDKEIEAELLQYLKEREEGKHEEKQEKKKYTTAMFFVMLVIAAKYIHHLI